MLKNQSSLTVRYETLTQSWFSIVFRPNVSLLLDANKFVKFEISKLIEPLLIQLDLVDSSGNFSRVEFECLFEKSDFTIWLVESLFVPLHGNLSMSQVESINLSFVLPIGRRGLLDVNGFHLGSARL